MNEKEATAMFLGEKLICKTPQDESIPPQKNAQLLRTIESLQQRLAAKEASMPEGSIAPVAFVSAGPTGGFYVSAEEYKFVPSQPLSKDQVKNNIGSGDSFASGVFAEYVAQCATLAEEHRETFSPEQLEKIIVTGQKLGRLCVMHKGAEVPHKEIKHEIYGDVTRQVNLTAFSRRDAGPDIGPVGVAI
jgi:fructose-1-phosphate kinase PfkB-like protein